MSDSQGRVVSLASLVIVAFLGEAVAADPRWISGPEERTAGQDVVLTQEFVVTAAPTRGVLTGVADFCRATVRINGEEVARRRPYGSPFEVDVTEQLIRGPNTIALECTSSSGPAAVFARLEIHTADGTTHEIVTDETWQWTSNAAGEPSRAVSTFGTVARFPWGDTDAARIEATDDYEQWRRADGVEATDPSMFQLPEGFEIERLRTAREEEGSWVATTFDPRGRLIVAREERGLLRMTFDERTETVERVEVIDDTLRECRGLVFVEETLYAMANEDKGLFRLRDTTGDDRFDDVRRIATFEGDAGHGRNQITLGPDGFLYAIFGDSVFEPEGITSRVPALATPSRLEETRSGFLARMNLESEEWEVVVRGLRNPFGIAFNADGEPFTYDADAEYDMGAPWYRPTRIDHLVSGADFGWRRVTKEWPPYLPDRPDMPRPTLDVGKGSPTAVAWGGRSNFPPAYRNSLFALDWAYGRILAVHLSPRGAGYAAGAETFLRGRPANVTDLEFGPDGAMYFVTGGRGTQSALYRVRYRGPIEQALPSTVQQRARRAHAEAARVRRRDLEGLHRAGTGNAVERIWTDLGDPDPWIAHAARMALEWQPVDRWRERALAEPPSSRALAALLALTLIGPSEVHAEVAARLGDFDPSRLDPDDLLTLIFVTERVIDGGTLSEDEKRSLLELLDAAYPHSRFAVNQRLGPLAKRLGARRLVARTIPLLEAAASQEERLQHLSLLRDVVDGWTPESRRTYFGALRRSSEFVAGEGMPTFLRLVRESSLDGLPEADRDEYERLLADDAVAEWRREVPDEPRPEVQKWTLADLAPALAEPGERDTERGRIMFAVARCILCHRANGPGGVTGPDLSSVARRFRPRDVLTSIVEPSKAIDEKYRLETFVLADGRVVTGRVLSGGDFRSSTLRVAVDPLDPTKVVEFAKGEVEVRKVSEVSPMPADLLNGLTRDEILDLLAWLDVPTTAASR